MDEAIRWESASEIGDDPISDNSDTDTDDINALCIAYIDILVSLGTKQNLEIGRDDDDRQIRPFRG